MAGLHVLVLPSWYPSEYNPTRGIFFRDQALAVRRSGVDVGVAYVEMRSLREFSVAAVARSHFQTTFRSEDGIPTLRIRGWNPLAQTVPGALGWGFLMACAAGEYTSRRGRPAMVHAQSSLWAGLAARLFAVRSGTPYIVTEHSSRFHGGVLGRAERIVASRVFKDAAAVLAVSESLQGSLASLMPPGRSPQVVPNVVDVGFWTLPPAPRVRDGRTFLTVANLVPGKGIDVLIRAFADRFRGSGANLVIGGDGPLRAELETMAHTLGVREQVMFRGRLSREEVRREMWGANCFVLASYHETFGVVLVEAMATGLPVVGTRCGGPEGIIGSEVGILVRPGDARALGDAMVAIATRIRTPPERVRAIVQARYSYETVGAILLKTYEEAIARRRAVSV